MNTLSKKLILQAKEIRKRVRQHLADIPIDRPIFVVGLQGGGLTLIRRILTRSPNMVFVNGNTRTWYHNDEMQNELATILPEELRLLGCKYYGHDGFHEGGWLYGTDEFFDYFRKTEEDVTSGLQSRFRAILKDVIAANALSLDGPRFIDKSQTYGLKIPFIMEMLRDCDPRFLIVTRNPYIACRKATEKGALAKLDVSYMDKLRLACQHYDNCLGTMLHDINVAGNGYALRFEDFLSDPPETIRNCCQFLGLDFTLRMLPSPDDSYQGGKWYPIREDVNLEYTKGLSGAELAVIIQGCEKSMKQAGYRIM